MHRLADARRWASPLIITAPVSPKMSIRDQRLGRYRWVVERTGAGLNRYRWLKVRYERRDDIHQAFLELGCALIC
jgi:hypothetical protein